MGAPGKIRAEHNLQHQKQHPLGAGEDLRHELESFSSKLEELKVKFEQYFLGIAPFSPEKDHSQLKRSLKKLQKAPFKSSSLGYKLKSLETRYKSYCTYWQRVLREKEEGTYHKDVFKVELRERQQQEAAYAQTAAGVSENYVKQLFSSYKGALEKQAGKAVKIDFGKFQSSIAERVKILQEQTGAKKISFSVLIKDGQVTLRAKAKEDN